MFLLKFTNPAAPSHWCPCLIMKGSPALRWSGWITGPKSCGWPIFPWLNLKKPQMNGQHCNTAHVIPPIGAQWLNMSLKDLAGLLDLAQVNPAGLGAPGMLDTYARNRHPDIKLRVAGIDALNRASIADGPLAQDLRAKGIQALYGMTPFRRTLMEMGLGAR
jgi:hypothetical protein